jgi:hypothetical protein
MIRPRRSHAIAAACALLLAAGGAFAEEAAKPPVLQALPEIAPPPNVDGTEPATEVTIAKKNDRETVEEARVNGILVWIKVTPTHGRPYYLIPTAGGNQFIRRDSLDTALKVPMWVLFSW